MVAQYEFIIVLESVINVGLHTLYIFILINDQYRHKNNLYWSSCTNYSSLGHKDNFLNS